MWIPNFSSIKSTAINAWNASKNMIDKRTPVQRLIDQIAYSQQQIIPTQKLTQLANMTYDIAAFDEILNTFIQRLRVFNYSAQKSNQTLNILIATNYIIKHGATGFVDELRSYVDVFQKYQTLKQVKTYEDEREQGKLDYNLQKIKSRAYHIQILLQDKHKLLKQKQLSMLVKQKLKLYEKDKISELKKENYPSKSPENQRQRELMNSQNISIKLQGIMEKYIWKYVDKLDGTIEMASQKIMEQIDKYVIGGQDIPQKFQIDDEEEKKQTEEEKEKKKEEEQLMKKLQQQANQEPIQQNLNTDLLQFEEVPSEKQKKESVDSLI